MKSKRNIQEKYECFFSNFACSSNKFSGLREWLAPSPKMQRDWWPLALGIAYVVAIATLGGVRWDHVGMGLLGAVYLYNEKLRQFLRLAFPLIVTGVIFDSLRYYYWQGISGHVHVVEPYALDLKWFGMEVGEGSSRRVITPNEFFLNHPSRVLDVLCGFAYLFFVAEYLAVVFYLFAKGKLGFLRQFIWAFFTVNLLGYLTYFIYPAAPPWYVTKYGFGPAQLHIPFSPAGGKRFDEFFGVHIFDDMYSRGTDVFAAYPSLHVAYPLLVVWATFSVDLLKPWRIAALGFYGLMLLSAVYLQQHYVEDVLLGSAFTLLTIVAVTLGARRRRAIS